MVRRRIRRSFGDVTFDVINTMILLVIVAATIYPFLYVLFASFSDPARFASHTGLMLRPLGFETRAYKAVF